MYFYKKYKTDNLLEFLKRLESKVSSDWIIGEKVVKRVSNINKILYEIEQCENSNELLRSRVFYIDKENLRKRLEDDIYTGHHTKLVKFILLKIEFINRNNNSATIGNYQNITVEHVLPQKPNLKEWSSFTQKTHKTYVNKLGNLTLLDGNKNAKLSNSNFSVKKEKYKGGKIDIFSETKKVFSKNTWDVNSLKERQKTLVNIYINYVKKYN